MKNDFLSWSCFFAVLIMCGAARSQDSSDNAAIKALADKACECSASINGALAKEKVIEEINSCIRRNTLLSQLTKVNEDSKKSEGTGEKKEYNITLDENFKEIQAYLYKNCVVVQKLMAGTDQVVLSENKKAMAFYEEGLQYTNIKNYDMAVVSYSKAVSADPKFVTAWNYLGLNYRRLNKYSEAIKCYQKSLDINPEGTMPLQNMAIAYELLNDDKKAAETYVAFTIKHPTDPEGYFGAGSIYYKMEEYEKGVDYMFRAYNLYKEAESPYVNDALENLKRYYADLNQKGKKDIFITAAKNNNIDLKE
ncbi:tetratricopeptide repeat protein [Flavobacterium sp. DGU11]|uniref:Tetratricopeptide repeat protein n=1 Tax=Flavobacterium arundinis TaxID=3139143 RepID=A0ABU9I0M8_9FLAO